MRDKRDKMRKAMARATIAVDKIMSCPDVDTVSLDVGRGDKIEILVHPAWRNSAVGQENVSRRAMDYVRRVLRGTIEEVPTTVDANFRAELIVETKWVRASTYLKQH